MYLYKKNRPCFTALRRGGVYPAYPIWPQRSLLCTLGISTPITSLVFISLPWSQRNRNTYAIFLIRFIFLNSFHCYHDRKCTLIPIFSLLVHCVFFSYFIFQSGGLWSRAEHSLLSWNLGFLHRPQFKWFLLWLCYFRWTSSLLFPPPHAEIPDLGFFLTLRIGTRQLGSIMSKCLS